MARNIDGCTTSIKKQKKTYENMTIIIMAANIGYGMKSYGPKALLTINKYETVIEHQIKILKNTFPNSDIILVVGFFADRMIRKCPKGVRIIENQLYENTNEIEQLRLALNCTITKNVLIIKDDVVFNQETLYDISKNRSCIVYDSKQQINDNNIGITIIDGYATIFSYDIPTKWCHIVYLSKKEKKMLQTICNRRENGKLYLHEALNMILKRIDKMRAIEPTGMKIVKIDTSRHLHQIRGTNENLNSK